MSRIAYGAHLARQFSEQLVQAAFATTLDFRILLAGEVQATPETPTWLTIVQDQLLDSSGPDSFDDETLDRLVMAARRAIVFAAPPIDGAAGLAIQSGLAGGGALFILTAAERVFLWIGRLRQAGDHMPSTCVWHRPPR